MTIALDTFAGLARFALPAMTLLAATPALAQAQDISGNRTQATRTQPTRPAPTPAPATQAQPAAVAQPAVSPLSQVPGVTVKPYNVTGTTIEDMRASMAAQRPLNEATGQPVPSSSTWSVGTSLKKQTTGDACKIVGATVQFSGEVTLPRLANPEGTVVAEPVMAEWQRFVGSLEQQQADYMTRVRARTPEVERAVMASTCDGAGAAATAAIDAIKASVQPAAPAPAPAPTN